MTEARTGAGLLAALEEKLVGYYGETDPDEVKAGFDAFPTIGNAYGPRDGCIAGVFDNDDVLQGVIDLFYTYYDVIRDVVTDDLGIKLPEWIKIVVEPSYEDTSFIVLFLCEKREVVFDYSVKAWHFEWESPEEMAEAMAADYQGIYRKTKKALEVKIGREI